MIHPRWMAGELRDIDRQVRNLSVTSNNVIVDIILTKSHLIEDDVIPQSFTHYLTHVAVWLAFLETDHSGIPLPSKDFPEFYYPVEFEREVYATTEKLKKELYALHQTYRI